MKPQSSNPVLVTYLCMNNRIFCHFSEENFCTCHELASCLKEKGKSLVVSKVVDLDEQPGSTKEDVVMPIIIRNRFK